MLVLLHVEPQRTFSFFISNKQFLHVKISYENTAYVLV